MLNLLKNKKNLLHISILTLIILLFFICLESVVPNLFLYDDNANYNLPHYAYNWRALAEGKNIPLVSFHQYVGQRHLGLGSSGVLYPPIYLSVFLSKLIFSNELSTIDILAISHFLVSGIGMYFLLRKLRISPTISTLCSLIWVTFPYLTSTSQSWVNRSYLIAYLPINFLLLEALLRKPKLKYALFLAVIKALLFFQGYVQHEFMLIQFELLFVIITITFALKKKNIAAIRKFLIPYIISFIVFVLLILPLLFPMIQAQQDSYLRSSPVSFGQFIAQRLSLLAFVKAQQFSFQPKAIFGLNSHIFYVGPFSLSLLALLAVIKTKNKLWRQRIFTYPALAFAALLLSTSFYGELYHLPLINLFRWPHKYFLFFLFFCSIGIAMSANILAQHVKGFNKLVIPILLSFIIGLNMTVVWQHKTNIARTDRIENPPHLEIANYINKNKGRVFTFRGLQSKHPYKHLNFNYASLFGFFHLGGYDQLTPSINAQASLRLQYTNDHPGPINQKLLDHLSTWSVKYIISNNTTSNKNQLNNFSQLKKTHQSKSTLIYENTESHPYVYALEQPDKPIPFEFGINHINAYPNNDQDLTLIVSIAPLPQYNFFINDKKIGPIPPSTGPMKIPIPKGVQKVTIKYIDYPFIVGTIIFLSFWLGLAIFFLIKQIYKRKKVPVLSITSKNKPGA